MKTSFKTFVESLLSNDESNYSDLHLFIDVFRIGYPEDKTLIKEAIGLWDNYVYNDGTNH